MTAISRRSFFIYEEARNIVQLSDSIDITLPFSGAVFAYCHAIQRCDFKRLLVNIFLQIQITLGSDSQSHNLNLIFLKSNLLCLLCIWQLSQKRAIHAFWRRKELFTPVDKSRFEAARVLYKLRVLSRLSLSLSWPLTCTTFFWAH